MAWVRWRDAGDPGTLYRATTEEALIEEMRLAAHTPAADSRAYMQAVGEQVHRLTGRPIRTDDAVLFVVELVRHRILDAVDVRAAADGTDDPTTVLPIPRAAYAALRLARLVAPVTTRADHA